MALDPDFSWESLPSLATPSAPAAGAEFFYTVSSGKRGNLIHANFQLSTSAVAADRTFFFQVKRGTSYLYRYPSSGTFAVQSASNVNVYEFGIGIAASDSINQTFRAGIMPDDFELNAGDVFSTTTSAKQSADQWTVNWVFKEVSDA